MPSYADYTQLWREMTNDKLIGAVESLEAYSEWDERVAIRNELSRRLSSAGKKKTSWRKSEQNVLEGIPYRFGHFDPWFSEDSRYFVEIYWLSPGRFEVVRANVLDSFLKRIGLMSENRTGDSEFDRDFIIKTENIDLAHLFFDSIDRRRAIQRLFKLGWDLVESDGLRLCAVRVGYESGPGREIAVHELMRLAKGFTERLSRAVLILSE